MPMMHRAAWAVAARRVGEDDLDVAAVATAMGVGRHRDALGA